MIDMNIPRVHAAPNATNSDVVLVNGVRYVRENLVTERIERARELICSLYADCSDEWPDRAEEVYAERVSEWLRGDA